MTYEQGLAELERQLEAPMKELDDVARRLGALKAAEDALRHAVRKAKKKGASWADIGLALGVTRQAAHQRFGTALYADCICPLDERYIGTEDEGLLTYVADCPCHDEDLER